LRAPARLRKTQKIPLRAVDDTVGNCAVVDSKPSPYDISGLKIVGDKSGYSSLPAAEKEIKADKRACKGIVERA
jgi:hypothetical protein